MRALIVDDERLARVELRRLLEIHCDIAIVGEAASLPEAEELIRTLRPELIFLDIEMPGGNTFELLDRLNLTDLMEPGPLPAILFTTAFDRYALRAFDVGALDYLLKPIPPERLRDALARVRANSSPARTVSGDVYLQQFFVREGELCWMVKVDELRLIESEGNYSRLLFGTNRPLILRSLQTLQQRLDPGVFFRANRNQIVNLGWVRAMELNPDGTLAALLRDPADRRSPSRVDFSRRQSQLFRDRMTV